MLGGSVAIRCLAIMSMAQVGAAPAHACHTLRLTAGLASGPASGVATCAALRCLGVLATRCVSMVPPPGRALPLSQPSPWPWRAHIRCLLGLPVTGVAASGPPHVHLTFCCCQRPQDPKRRSNRNYECIRICACMRRAPEPVRCSCCWAVGQRRRTLYACWM